MPTDKPYAPTRISMDDWAQAVTTTAHHALDTVAGHPQALPTDEWTATFEPTDDGGCQGRVCGPLATAYYQGCADTAHWPDAERLAAAITGAPLPGNWLKRTLHRMRMPRSFPPTAYLELPPPTAGTGHTVCWEICVIPSLVDLQITADATSQPWRRQPAMPPSITSLQIAFPASEYRRPLEAALNFVASYTDRDGIIAAVD